MVGGLDGGVKLSQQDCLGWKVQSKQKARTISSLVAGPTPLSLFLAPHDSAPRPRRRGHFSGHRLLHRRSLAVSPREIRKSRKQSSRNHRQDAFWNGKCVSFASVSTPHHAYPPADSDAQQTAPSRSTTRSPRRRSTRRTMRTRLTRLSCRLVSIKRSGRRARRRRKSCSSTSAERFSVQRRVLLSVTATTC